jgi:hypothetical protein
MPGCATPHFRLALDARHWDPRGSYSPGLTSGGYRLWLIKAAVSSFENFKGRLPGAARSAVVTLCAGQRGVVE